jgi:hypothetical protein
MATYYIDPSAPTNGNGLSEATPFNTWKTTLWTGHTAAVGNRYLQKRGTTWALHGSDAQPDRSIAWSVSGDSANRVVLSYYGDSSLAMPKIIPGPGVTAGIVFSTNTHHVTIDGLEITGHAGKLIQNGGSTNTNDISIIVQNCYLHDNSGAFNGLDLRGQNCKVLNCIIDNIGSDGVWLDCNNAEVGYCTISNPSVNDNNGDCLQFSGTSGNIYVHHNTLDHRNKDSKHCLIVSTMTAGYTGGVIEYNTCLAYVGATVNKPIFIGSKNLIVRSNIFKDGFNNTISGEGTDNSNGTKVYGNMFLNQVSYNLDCYGVTSALTGVKVYNNTFIRSLTTLSNIRNNYNSNEISFTNNILVGSNYGLEIRSLDTHSYNLFYNQTTYPIFNAQLGAQVTVPGDSLNTNPLLDSGYYPTSTSPAIAAGTKYWSTGPRPSDLNGKPVPDYFIDIGAVQSTFNPIHPANIG